MHNFNITILPNDDLFENFQKNFSYCSDFPNNHSVDEFSDYVKKCKVPNRTLCVKNKHLVFKNVNIELPIPSFIDKYNFLKCEIYYVQLAFIVKIHYRKISIGSLAYLSFAEDAMLLSRKSYSNVISFRFNAETSMSLSDRLKFTSDQILKYCNENNINSVKLAHTVDVDKSNIYDLFYGESIIYFLRDCLFISNISFEIRLFDYDLEYNSQINHKRFVKYEETL